MEMKKTKERTPRARKWAALGKVTTALGQAMGPTGGEGSSGQSFESRLIACSSFSRKCMANFVCQCSIRPISGHGFPLKGLCARLVSTLSGSATDASENELPLPIYDPKVETQ
ncbi:hypothetical protein CRG98_019968 [Punica granatum]|uniref:Uncharacterized protein n=1 Tax=Punica granatum TaxID=22663 RepID=A0A2I0JTN2_PUNGR|nr:hypothetical protein CRG98_019968 [Punica granatum]